MIDKDFYYLAGKLSRTENYFERRKILSQLKVMNESEAWDQICDNDAIDNAPIYPKNYKDKSLIFNRL